MYNLIPMQFCEAIDDLLYYHNRLFLRNADLFVDLVLKHTSIAVLDDHYLQGIVFVDVIATHDVLALAEHH